MSPYRRSPNFFRSLAGRHGDSDGRLLSLRHGVGKEPNGEPFKGAPADHGPPHTPTQLAATFMSHRVRENEDVGKITLSLPPKKDEYWNGTTGLNVIAARTTPIF